MAIFQLLSKLQEIERRTAELYERMAARLSSKDGAGSRFFRILADEERLHERHIETIKSYFLESPESFTEDGTARQLVDEVLENISRNQHILNGTGDQQTSPGLARLALKLEEEMEGRHHSFYLHIQNEQLKNLLQSLTNWDSQHIARLKEFLNMSVPAEKF